MIKTSAPGGSEVIFIFWSSPPLLPMKITFVQPVKDHSHYSQAQYTTNSSHYFFFLLKELRRCVLVRG